MSNFARYFSGLANKKTVSIQPGGKDLSVVLATTKTKKQSKPASLYNRSVLKKEFRKMTKAVVNQVRELLNSRHIGTPLLICSNRCLMQFIALLLIRFYWCPIAL